MESRSKLMRCPRCGTTANVDALMCRKCGFHFDEPYAQQMRKRHSAAWWIVVIAVVLAGLTLLTTILLQLMVRG